MSTIEERIDRQREVYTRVRGIVQAQVNQMAPDEALTMSNVDMEVFLDNHMDIISLARQLGVSVNLLIWHCIDAMAFGDREEFLNGILFSCDHHFVDCQVCSVMTTIDTDRAQEQLASMVQNAEQDTEMTGTEYEPSEDDLSQENGAEDTSAANNLDRISEEDDETTPKASTPTTPVSTAGGSSRQQLTTPGGGKLYRDKNGKIVRGWVLPEMALPYRQILTTDPDKLMKEAKRKGAVYEEDVLIDDTPRKKTRMQTKAAVEKQDH